MELNFKKAFNSPVSDEKWYIKLILPAIMAVVSLGVNLWYKGHEMEVFVVYLIALVPALILSGFFTQFANNEIHDKSPLLPELESGVQKFLTYGAKLLGIMLIYAIVLGLLGTLIGFVLGIGLGIISAILNFKALIPITFILLFLPVAIIITAFLVLVEGIFFDNFDFKEALNYKRAFNLLTKVKLEVAMYMLFLLGFGVVVSIINSILTLMPYAIIIAVVPVAMGQLISVNLKAQVYKIAKSRLS